MAFDNTELDTVDVVGVVPVFPLPNLVMFPGVIQALHIFEDRYRHLVRHALANDRLMATALTRPESAPSSRQPPIFQTVTVGKIIAHTELDDGRYNLLLRGLKRARITREIVTQLPYRMAQVEVVDDVTIQTDDLGSLKNLLLQRFRELRDHEAEAQLSAYMLQHDLSLGTLADLIAFSIGLSEVQQQELLQTTEVGCRCSLLLEMMDHQLKRSAHAGVSDAVGFPPQFSYN